MRSPDDPRATDLSREVKDHCSELLERKMPGGDVIQALYPPELGYLAVSALDMMERLHSLLEGDLALKLPSGARTYLVQLDEYPPSFLIEEHSRHTVVFALFSTRVPEEQKIHVLEHEIYGTLAHEWTHGALGRMFPERSAVNRVRWINDGAASYFDYEAQRALSSDAFDNERALRLPLFSLEETSLEALCAWEHARARHVADLDLAAMQAQPVNYGPALGLFLRIAEHGGTENVWQFLGEMRKLREPSPAETDEVLLRVTGRRFSDLAAISEAERDRLYEEALVKLDGSSPFAQKYGLAVLSKFPERIGSHIAKLKEMEANTGLSEGIRAGAARLLAEQSTVGGQAP